VVKTDVKLSTAKLQDTGINNASTGPPKTNRGDGSSGADVTGSAIAAVFESRRELVPFKYGGDAFAVSEVDTSIEK
jgi:hypothetical protein